jgi:hypothetical protein
MLTTAPIAAGLSSALAIVVNAQSVASMARNAIELQDYTVDSGLRPYTSDGKSSPGFVRAAFLNRGDVAATEVRFAIESCGERYAVIDDVGYFSSGVSIRHRIHNDSISSDAKVHIAEVRYPDGSTWSEDAGARLPERRQASGPEAYACV